MKLLFSLLFSAVTFTEAAQVIGPDTDKQIEESIRERVEKLMSKSMSPTFPLFRTKLPHKDDGSAARKGPGVYALPQDNMPCVVPNTAGIAVIPNAAPALYPYRKDMPTKPFGPEGSK